MQDTEKKAPLTAAAPLLIDARTLRERLERGLPPNGQSLLRILDLRWAPGGPTARQRYDAGHIPGAYFVDLDRDLSHAQPRGPGGRHPMVSPEEFAQLLSRLGISEETQVVIYDEGNSAIAARLWFQLRLHGHQNASLLDGGLWAWKQAGFPLEQVEPPAPEPAPPRKLIRDADLFVDRARIAALVASRRETNRTDPLLLDARAPERYRGEVEPLDPIGGHIPGAINVPFARLLRGPDDPRWRSPDDVRALLDEMIGSGRRERALIASCGSGVTACHLLAALELTSSPKARLYGGSYSDWVSDPTAEVAKGSEPG